MVKEVKRELERHLDTLWEYQQHLFDQGHTFWHCDSQDRSHNKPFYYYQINRSTNMSTCSTCYKLMENRKKIRSIEKLMGKWLTPLWTNHTEDNIKKRMSVSNSSEFNPNYQYL